MPEFRVEAPFEPTGDQPEAIMQLVDGIREGYKMQTLLGVTGSGKTYTVAKIVEQVQKPTLVLAPNKTLAAQLYSEFKEFFPNNAVEYSVSCIYGLGSPEEYGEVVLTLKVGEERRRDKILRHLTEIQYERNDANFIRGRFRVRGDVLEIFPAYEDVAVRVEFFGDEIERMTEIDPLTGEVLGKRVRLDIYPAKHWVTTQARLNRAIELIEDELEDRLKELEAEGKLLEAARLRQRTNFDIEMLRETGFCSGVENYSRHLAGRAAGEQPWTLMDYLPDDYLLVVDESHVALPQVRGMFAGDRSRKQVLVDYGFRLPSAMDNRPLTFAEFERQINQALFVSATPGPYEYEHGQAVVEQVIRPTGLIDPQISVRPTRGQIDDLLAEIRLRVSKGQRVLVTTLTKKMAEDLADYMQELSIKVHYLHSEIETIERVDILRDLRLGVYDVVVGINLLREGLDLPEVSLVAILDADKEGFLRSEGSLIQITGRAARHVEGSVIMYADTITKSMQRAIDETNRRRRLQTSFNERHNITPRGIKKEIKTLSERIKEMSGVSIESADGKAVSVALAGIPRDEALRLIKDLESQMRAAAKQLEFEKAAQLRDQIIEIRRSMVE